MLAAVRALIFLSLIACGTPPARPPASAPPAQQAAEETFTGAITQIDFGCAADARCSLVVDNTKTVAFGHDSRGQAPAEWGDSAALFELMGEPQQGVGRRVEVFAAKNPDGGYTLRGKSTYYVKVLPP